MTWILTLLDRSPDVFFVLSLVSEDKKQLSDFFFFFLHRVVWLIMWKRKLQTFKESLTLCLMKQTECLIWVLVCTDQRSKLWKAAECDSQLNMTAYSSSSFLYLVHYGNSFYTRLIFKGLLSVGIKRLAKPCWWTNSQKPDFHLRIGEQLLGKSLLWFDSVCTN